MPDYVRLPNRDVWHIRDPEWPSGRGTLCGVTCDGEEATYVAARTRVCRVCLCVERARDRREARG